MARRTIATPAGNLTTTMDPGQVWRVGYRPEPWSWTPWQYAEESGRFGGRWDDPADTFRTIYASTGVQFESRHGDHLTLWAVFERDADGDTSTRLHDTTSMELRRDDSTLLEAFRLHRLTWSEAK